jgi:hypothetical protein
MLYFLWFIFNRTRSGNLWQWSDCFNVDILNFFKLHVNFINSRRHVMNLLVCFLDVYMLIDMAVTSDNKLLLCNYKSSHHKIYIYKDYKTYEDEISLTSRPYCITVVPCLNNNWSFLSLYNKLKLIRLVVISLKRDPSVFNIITLSSPPM